MGRTKRAKKILNDSHGFIALQTLSDFFFSGSRDTAVILDSYYADFVSVNKNAKHRMQPKSNHPDLILGQ